MDIQLMTVSRHRVYTSYTIQTPDHKDTSIESHCIFGKVDETGSFSSVTSYKTIVLDLELLAPMISVLERHIVLCFISLDSCLMLERVRCCSRPL